MDLVVVSLPDARATVAPIGATAQPDLPALDFLASVFSALLGVFRVFGLVPLAPFLYISPSVVLKKMHSTRCKWPSSEIKKSFRVITVAALLMYSSSLLGKYFDVFGVY